MKRGLVVDAEFVRAAYALLESRDRLMKLVLALKTVEGVVTFGNVQLNQVAIQLWAIDLVEMVLWKVGGLERRLRKMGVKLGG